jgi:O-antigen ligase
VSDVTHRVTLLPASLLARPPSPRLVLATALVVAVALALALLPPLAALWLVFGTGLAALVLMQPTVGLYLLPFAVGFGSLVSLTIHGIHAGPTDLLVAALVLAWAVRLIRRLTLGPRPSLWPSVPTAAQLALSLHAVWRREPLRLALYAALSAYLAGVTVSLAVATDRVLTLKEILKWGEVVALVAIAAWLLSDLPRVRGLTWSVIAAGTLQAIVGFGQWASLGSEAVTGRILGTFAQPNPLAGYLNFALPLALALVLFSPDWRERWLAGGTGVLLAGGEVLARSRGATLGLIAALLLIAVIGWHAERLFAWVASVVLPLAAIAWITHLIPLSLQQRLLDEVRLDDAALCDHINNANFSIMQRLANWAAGLRMFEAHPLLGVGAGNYDAAYAAYATSCWPDALGHAHNYYITAAAETGIVGLIAFLALTGMTFAIGAWATRATRDHASQITPPAAAVADSKRSANAPHGEASSASSTSQYSYEATLAHALAVGFFAAVVALAVQNLTDDLFVHAMELQFALCLAALLRLSVLWHGTP